MYLNAKQTSLLSEVMKLLASSYNEREVRIRIGELLLELLNADCYASYLWDDKEKRFIDRVSLNMSDDNLGSYETYYQFNDPITHRLKECVAPTRVTDILPQFNLVKTEFFNDFLKRDGLYWGVNLYADVDGQGTGDMRIWRTRTRSNFDDNDLAVLKMVSPAFGAALRRCRQINHIAPTSISMEQLPSTSPKRPLTSRELEVARLAATGLSDKEIARQLGISFTTVRTHMEHAFRKLHASNRVQLAARLS